MRADLPLILKNWFIASRPKTLFISLAPIIFSFCIAEIEKKSDIKILFWAFLSLVLMQIAANFSNDYFDFKNEKDTSVRLGPQRFTGKIISARNMKYAIITTYALAIIVSSVPVFRGGIPILFIGILGILIGLSYTGGPFPLAYNALGDIAVFLVFGPLSVCSCLFLQTLQIPSANQVILSFVTGFFAVAILIVNNLRDYSEDLKTGKTTLIVLLGINFGKIFYIISLLFPALIIFLYRNLFFRGSGQMALFTFIFLGPILIPARAIVSYHPPTDENQKSSSYLNRTLAQTSLLSLSFAIGLLLAILSQS